MHSHAHECVRVDMCMREFSQLQSWSSMRVHICQIRMRVHTCQISITPNAPRYGILFPAQFSLSSSLARARARARSPSRSLTLARLLSRSLIKQNACAAGARHL